MSGSNAFESCCDAFEGFKACPKRATWQFRSPIETAGEVNREACGAYREAPWQSKRDAAEGCAVRRPAKASARVLKF